MKWCEPLTDSEKRIFLAAMGREKKSVKGSMKSAEISAGNMISDWSRFAMKL